MGIFDSEMILPGAITEIESDYNYGYDTSLFGTTDSVTIIGTAFNGPVGKPVQIYSPEHAKYMFGGTYDYKTRREATLVAEIQDAWDRGCRTIYAVRVSGKDIFKDFQFAIETKLKLRLSGIFPSNDNKDVYFAFDNTEGAMTIKIFKPSTRATIQEKLQGLVENDSSILVTTLELSNSYGYTKDSRLVEMIKTVNEHAYNNVIRLSIVDENGNDVTIASKEAQALSVGAMFAGAYFIGRDANKVVAATDMNYEFASTTNKPYEAFDGILFKRLTINTDVVADLPIYADTVDALNQKFASVGVSMSTMWDILSITGKVDDLYTKDSIDYEEVDISDFDLYKRLGSGFAITAKAELKGAGPDIKIKETPVSDNNRVVAISDGIYSMLENLTSDYRVLANGVADSAIIGKLPKKADFKVARPVQKAIFDGKVIATSKVDADDLSEAKKYKFVLMNVPSTFGQPEIIEPALYTAKIIKMVGGLANLAEVDGKTFANGTLFMLMTTASGTETGKLYRYSNGTLVALDDAVVNVDLVDKIFIVNGNAYIGTEAAGKVVFEALDVSYFGTKEYVLVDTGASVAVYEAVAGADEYSFKPVGALSEVFDDNEDKTLVTVESVDMANNVITIQSSVLDFTTLEEFVGILNEGADLTKLFTFAVAPAAAMNKDEYVYDVTGGATPLISLPAGTTDVAYAAKSIVYDTTIYIPYKTTDNFARHLAQHCTYTGLKTAPTHGTIGCSKLLDVNLSSVAKKVDAVAAVDLNLYAKKPNGRDMLDRNNLPHPIGKNISVVVGQYVVAMDGGYNYISNGASGYAGMVSALPLDQSSTSQAINIPTPQYDLTNYQLEKLTQKGFVTFKQSYTKGVVVTDGITMAPATSSFRRLSVTRIINAIEEVIRAAVEPFIGKQNHLANRNSMQTAIKSSLEKLKGKLIESYEFKLNVDTANTKLGIVDIDYAIVPVYEIREVRNRITVRDAS